MNKSTGTKLVLGTFTVLVGLTSVSFGAEKQKPKVNNAADANAESDGKYTQAEKRLMLEDSSDEPQCENDSADLMLKDAKKPDVKKDGICLRSFVPKQTKRAAIINLLESYPKRDILTKEKLDKLISRYKLQLKKHPIFESGGEQIRKLTPAEQEALVARIQKHMANPKGPSSDQLAPNSTLGDSSPTTQAER